MEDHDMTAKWICGLLVTLLAFGPLAPLTATAQMAPPPPPVSPPPGAPPAVTPVPPPLYQPMPRPLHREPGPGAAVGAGFLNVVHVPGKAILCGFGTLAGAGLMVLTFGNAYRAAVSIFNEGCGGPWALTAYDVADVRPPDESY
jgi:hypothetical protein